jgi:hypothetical protein
MNALNLRTHVNPHKPHPRTVTVEEASAIFDSFKVMKTSQTWKAFEASGDTSEEGVSA